MHRRDFMAGVGGGTLPMTGGPARAGLPQGFTVPPEEDRHKATLMMWPVSRKPSVDAIPEPNRWHATTRAARLSHSAAASTAQPGNCPPPEHMFHRSARNLQKFRTGKCIFRPVFFQENDTPSHVAQIRPQQPLSS